MALKTPHVTKTLMHTLVKTLLRQRELGMIAGRPSLSCRPHQKTNVGIRTKEVTKSAIVPASLMFETSAVKILWVISGSNVPKAT